MRLILASTSPTRGNMLRAAGVDFVVRPSGIDERVASRHLTAAAEIAQHLAAAKALAVARLEPQALVIGADQTLDCAGEVFAKPADRAAAAAQLARLAGRTHRLHSAVAVAQGERVVWHHLASPALDMRPLAPAEIERYLDRAGPAALGSVGAYQVEGPGIQLFGRIDGDWPAILGLPLIPLLAYLREAGHMTWC